MQKIDLWNQFNTQEDEQVCDVLNKIAANASPNDPIREKCKKEQDVWMRVLTIHSCLNTLDFDNSAFQKIANHNCSTDVINYCRSRYAEDTSVMLKWHYCVVLYFAEKGNWLKKAIPLILQSARTDDGTGTAIYLTLAFNLNKIYGCEQKDAIKNAAIYILNNKQDTKFLGACVRIICRLEKSQEIKKESLDTLMTLAENQDDGEFEDSLKHAIEAAQDKDQIRTKLAKHYEKRGDAQSEPLVKMIYYKNARKYFHAKSDKEKIDNKIKNAIKSVRLVEMATKTKVEKLPIQGENNLQRQQSLVRLFRSRLPNVAKIEQVAKGSQYSTASAFTNEIKISDSGLLAPSNLSKEQSEHIEKLERVIMFNDILLSISVRDYEKDGKITIKDHMDYLRYFDLHSKPILNLIECGIKRHYEEDYVSSIHILIPQIENTLRKLLEQKKDSIVTSTKKGMEYVKLGSLICDGSEILGSDFTKYLMLKLVDINSINLRNKVCHSSYGEFEYMKDEDIPADFSHPMSLSLILIIALLTGLSEKTT